MGSLQQNMSEYTRMVQAGVLPAAYRGLMDYIQELRTHFKNRLPEDHVPGNVYFGYMDMTYFSIVPAALKARGLKIAVVFLHAACRFEVWLSASNKNIQARYWQMLKDSPWKRYRLVPALPGADSILEHTLAESPDFNDLPALTRQIEKETLAFIGDVENFLLTHDQNG